MKNKGKSQSSSCLVLPGDGCGARSRDGKCGKLCKGPARALGMRFQPGCEALGSAGILLPLTEPGGFLRAQVEERWESPVPRLPWGEGEKKASFCFFFSPSISSVLEQPGLVGDVPGRGMNFKLPHKPLHGCSSPQILWAPFSSLLGQLQPFSSLS